MISDRGIFFNGAWHAPNTEIYKELLKWEKDGRDGRPMYRPEDNPYPKMLYKAERRADGIVSCVDPLDDAWSARHQLIVGKSFAEDRNLDRAVAEETQAIKQGWSLTIPEAVERYNTVVERAVSTLAAQRAYEDRNMSEPAKREVAEAEAASPMHVAEVPEKPKARRGRPPKTAQA